MVDTVEFSRLYLAVFFSVVAAFYTARIVFLQQRTTTKLIFPGQIYCRSWWNHQVFRGFRITIWLVCLARLFFPELDHYVGVLSWLNKPEVIIPGLILLSLGFSMTVMAHFQLGRDWRSGVDPSGPSELMTTGFYQYSRNPMFCCIAVAQFGFFLSLPSYFSLVCLAVGLFTLSRQVKVEEQHLSELFSDEYTDYTARVRRWV